MKTNSWKYCSETIKNIKMFKAAGIDSLAGSFLIDDALVLLKKKTFYKVGNKSWSVKTTKSEAAI